MEGGAVLASSRFTADQAKAKVIELVGAGATIRESLAHVERSEKTYEGWRRDDPEFREKMNATRNARQSAKDRGANPDYMNIGFEDFRREFLFMDTYPHQRAWIDLLEGREPTLRPGERYTPGASRNRLLINTPPFHAKSTVITMDYAAYRICKNPNIAIVIISQTQNQAKKFLLGIKRRLTGPKYAKLRATFAPGGGFRPESGEGEWSNTRIYVSGNDSSEKDPTVEALGIGGQIYGNRADLIILDDVATTKNAHEYEKHLTWLQQDVMSRLSGGQLIVVGTRVASQDIYSELLNGDRYLTGTSPWTHLAQPAVLQFADDPRDWVTLWPRSSQKLREESEDLPDENGLYQAWDGPRLATEVRNSVKPTIWSLVYQQETSLGDDATFRPLLVWGAVDRRRKPGPLTAGAWGHPGRGGEGMYTIASMDPAMAGETFTVVGKVDRATQKRWIENCYVQASPPAEYFRNHIKQVTLEYGVQEWVIEEQGFQGFLVHDPEIRNFLNTRGVRMTGHYTGKNKTDPDFGVASLAPLFGTSRRINEGAGREVFNADSNLIELPDPEHSSGVQALIEELLNWQPGIRGSKLRMDGPMALWFWELRARIILGVGAGDREPQQFVDLPFMSRGVKAQRASAPMSFFNNRRVVVGRG